MGFAEVTSSRQKKETRFFVLRSTFRNFGFAEVTVHSEMKRKHFFFCISLVFS